ncbi:MAG: DNA methyltransferase, partial [Desulfatibacillaceae bacterium]|nr:DNA methyltransferase [Desulfatibacillaceae bacterium]
MAKPPLVLQTTTLWDYPSQHYGDTVQGDPDYAGATPSFVIWNLLSRYTHKGEIVVDPMAGSGTTLDVAKDLERKAFGFDIAPFRKDIAKADARKIPLKNACADFVFVDPPYSTHIAYSDDPACIGRLDAASRDYSRAMEQVIREMDRILKPGRYMALYVSDSFKKGKPFIPIGIELFE